MHLKQQNYRMKSMGINIVSGVNQFTHSRNGPSEWHSVIRRQGAHIILKLCSPFIGRLPSVNLKYDAVNTHSTTIQSDSHGISIFAIYCVEFRF